MKIDWNEAPYWAYCVAEREGNYHWLGVDKVRAWGGVINSVFDEIYTVIEDRPVNWSKALDRFTDCGCVRGNWIWYDRECYKYMLNPDGRIFTFGAGSNYSKDSVKHHASRAAAVIPAPAPYVPPPAPVQVENSGGSCGYYRVFIEKPTTAGESYTAECNDVIEALNMTYAESNMFKEIWRTAAARTLGKHKAGHNEKRGAEKIVFFAKRHAIKHGVK